MLFNSFQYLQFLPVIVALYWIANKHLRPFLLLLASYYFYMAWFARYGLLLALLTLVNYVIGIVLADKRLNQLQKKSVFIGGVCANLGCLVFFKYTNFLVSSCWQVLGWISRYMGQSYEDTLQAPHLQILLPLGISFFVFEFVHYLSDVYNGSYAIKNPIRFGLFAAFFPSQIAGPIKRYEDFDQQVRALNPFSAALFRSGCWLILEGMFKKVVLGDNLALIVQHGYAHPENLAMSDAWLCSVAFAFQIYYDFSGYTDIGRGSAMLFGFKIPENFNQPYLATSLIDFWRRWHISLSTWLRDYLYKPLNGSRNGVLQKNRNLLITMLLGGLWHGASWHFIFWGLFHGLGLMCNHAWRQITSNAVKVSGTGLNLVGAIFSTLITFLFVDLGWVLFRADSAKQALIIYRQMFGWGLFHKSGLAMGPCLHMLSTSAVPAGFLLYGTFHLIKYISAQNPHWSRRLRIFEEMEANPIRWWLPPPSVVQLTCYLSCVILILALSARGANPFIYFRF